MVIGFRDPHGIRPLVAGELPEGGYMVASESCAFSPLDGRVTHELEPGEMAIIDTEGMRFAQGAPSPRKAMCMFEFIYFARPDSQMYGTLLYTARERMGEQLAVEHPVEADVVVPVPDSGIPAALGYSAKSGIPFREGMTKSRYIHRTFIAPDQKLREMGVKMKLTPLMDHIMGGGACTHHRSSDQMAMLLRHRYVLEKGARRRQHDDRGNQRPRWSNFAGLPVDRWRGESSRQTGEPVLSCLLQRRISPSCAARYGEESL